MTMTNDLRKLIKARLETVMPVGTQVYYQLADSEIFPHAIFTLEGMSVLADDMNRRDYSLIIDFYSRDMLQAEAVADEIQELMNGDNLPQTSILPTFYLESRRAVIDEDKYLYHRQLTYSVQLYERK